MPKPKHHVFVCGQSRQPGHPRGSCGISGAAELFQEFMKQITVNKLGEQVALTQTGCLGPCHVGANVLVYPEGIMYAQLSPADVEVIVSQHLIGGEPVADKQAPAEVW